MFTNHSLVRKDGFCYDTFGGIEYRLSDDRKGELMIRRFFMLLTAALMLFTNVYAEPAAQNLLIRPGKSERIAFTAAKAGLVTVSLTDANGVRAGALKNDLKVEAGQNFFVWDGYLPSGAMTPEGSYLLRFAQEGSVSDQPVTVGSESPVIKSFTISGTEVVPGKEWSVTAQVNQPGTLSISMNFGGYMKPVASMQAKAGENTLLWDGTYNGQTLSGGSHLLALELTDDTGFASTPHYISIQLADANAEEPAQEDPTQDASNVIDDIESEEPSDNNGTADGADETTGDDAADSTPEGAGATAATPAATPAPMQYKPPTAENVPEGELGSNYWTLPAGEWNEEAIWKVMMQPIIVVKGLGKQAQKEMYRLRATPDDSMKRENVLGEITCESQGVHVLETLDNGWTLVEIFNSSYGPNCTARPGWGNTDDLLRGYVETNRLMTIQPAEDYGLLIDKLKQVMYVFKDGKKFSELLISTGLPTKKQPWNETPTGEFLMVSRSGGFPSGNMYCDMAMRINGGSLIHEVPYIENPTTKYKDYSAFESQLGKKASHGCVRVQRKKNDEGLNMTWLWNNIKVNTKVLIWDDTPGRYHEYPADDLTLYYNPKGGKYYHSDSNCPSIRKAFLPLKGTIAYSHLEDAEFAKLTPCKTCKPPLRKSLIDEQNRENGFQP